MPFLDTKNFNKASSITADNQMKLLFDAHKASKSRKAGKPGLVISR